MTTELRSTLAKIEGIAYGADYYPEQWSREVWAKDIELMRRAGVNLVTVGVFSWALIEVDEGDFDFSVLDEVIEGLHDVGIRVDLATPTAGPPAWFYAKYPEARVVNRDGVPLGPGSRGAASPSHPAYRAAVTRVAGALAERYGYHPGVVMWHVHNEYGVPVCQDFSASSVAAFRGWLQERYENLDALNEAWGTAFWGQCYRKWEHIGLPGLSATAVNPTQQLDFQRFSDDQLLECFRSERDAIRVHSDRPVTTNFMANSSPHTDLWKWAQEVDVVANDHYLWATDEHPEIGLSVAADLSRSLAGGKPWVLMEHSTSAVNWQPRNYAKRPGEMARNSLAHVGRGADAILFFQWRASRAGAEKFHSAMVPHAGTNTRVWREVENLGATLGRLAEVKGSRVHADVAIMWDFDSFWAQDLEYRPSEDVNPQERIRCYYEYFWARGIAVDFVHPSGVLSGYRLVVMPAQYMLSSEEASSVNAYVADGGVLIVSYFSAVVDRNDHIHEGGFLAPLQSSLGVSVGEFLPMRPDETADIVWADGRKTIGDQWQEDLVVEDAEVLATWDSGPARTKAAITRRRSGRGVGWYVSTRLNGAGTADLMDQVMNDAQLDSPEPMEGLERVSRVGKNATYSFYINHHDEPITINDAAPGTDLVSGNALDGELAVPGGGFTIVRSRRSQGQ